MEDYRLDEREAPVRHPAAVKRLTESPEKEGVIWRCAGTGELIGVGILDHRDLWCDRRRDLAREMARRFDVSC